MTDRIVRLELHVLIANGTFAIYDDAGEQIVPDLNDPREWLFAGDNAIVASSAGHTDHRASLAMEICDGEPPDLDDAWEVRGHRTLRLDSGDLEVKPGEPPPFTQILRVGPPGTYHLRGYSAGRDDIRRMTPNPDIYALCGVERFL